MSIQDDHDYLQEELGGASHRAFNRIWERYCAMEEALESLDKDLCRTQDPNIQKATLIKKSAYLAESGMTDGEFRGKCQRGKFINGVHYFIIDRATWVDVEAIEAWVRRATPVLEPSTSASKSANRSAAKGRRASSKLRGTKPTERMQVV